MLETKISELQNSVVKQNHVEETLRQYEKIVSNSTDLMAFLDNNFTYLYCNKTYLEAFGKNSEELIGLTEEDVFGKEFFESVIRPNALRCLSGKVINYKDWFNFPAYGKRFMEIYYYPYSDKQNQIKGIVVNARDITDSKLNENKLKESEHWNKEIFEGSRDAIFIVNEYAKIVDCNKSAEDLTGYSKNQLFKMSIPDLHEENDLGAYKKFFKSIIMGESVITEAKLLRKDGTKIETEFSNKQVLIKNVPYMHTVAREITERKKAEINTIESQQRLANHLDNTPLGAIFWDNDFKVIDWNKSAEKIFGYKKEETLGRHANELIVPKELQPQIDDVFNHLLTQTGGERSTNENITKDGKRILCDWYNVAVTDLNGKVTGVASLVDDITENKNLEKQLKESEGKYRNLFENSYEGIFLHDLKGNILDFNKKTLMLFGYSKSELLSLNVRDLHPPEEYQKSENAFKSIMKNGQVSFEINFKKKNGQIFPSEVSSNIIVINNQKLVFGLVRDISERKKTEKILKESEERYRTLFENNSVGVYVSTVDGKILDCNESFVNMMGYSSKEEVLKTSADNFHQSKKERTKFLNKLKIKNALINFESEPRKKDGSIIYTIENVQLIGGNILQGTIVDITELKNVEMALKLSNEFNESLIETIPYGLDIVDMDGNILFMNDLLKDAIGDENPKGKCWEFYKDNNEQCTQCPLKNEMELGEVNICEVHNVLGGREYEITHTTMNFENKMAMLEIFKDITEEKTAEKKIRQLSRGVEQSPEMIIITDLDGNVEYANPRVTDITGYTLNEIIGKNTSILQSGKTPKITYEELWETITKGEIWEGELLNKRKNGEEYWERASISPIINDKGETINYIAIKEDITDKINTRNELIDAKEKAEEMNKIKSNFFANMSHELRTPLVGILGFTEILNESIEDRELKEYAGMINEAGQRLLETLNLILDLSKIESEHIEVELSNVDIIETIQESIQLFNIIAASKKLYIKLESDIKKLEIKTDARMISQILNNLLNNAVKFTKEGGVTITAKKIKKNSLLEIQVKDTGIGIPKEKLEIVWKEFRQVSEGMARMFEGSGLGLTVTREFVQKLGGELKLKSQVDKGSTFTVLLPIRESSIPIITKEPAFTFGETTEVQKTKDTKEELKTLLFVDDDKLSRGVVKQFLSGIYKVDLALDGKEGIEKSRKKKYDGVLMDINLKSKPDGTQTAKKIKEMKGYKDVPIISVTAYAMIEDREKYSDAGYFTDYISKPFTKQDLIELINKTIKEKT